MPGAGLRRRPWLALLLCFLGLFLMTPLLSGMGDGLVALGLMVILAWTLAPLAALGVTAYACRHGAEPMLCFFIPALGLWLGWLVLRLPAPRWSAALCLGLGLIGANIGAEYRRRRPDKDGK